tara:strand:- start:124 stop:336 length:213 start_codon:yes stop_codon:yes gene_type:complete
MGKTKQEFLDKLEKLQTDYAECKINTEQFDQGLKDIGIHSQEERMFEKLDAEEARYEFKMDKAAEQARNE